MVTIKTIDPKKLDTKLINQALEHLRQGYILIYPTDTSYGIGVVYNNQKALESVSKLKNRPEEKRYSVIVPDISWILRYCQVNPEIENILRQYLPGKYTFIVREKGNSQTLGIRIPSFSFIQMLALRLGTPITATSANISGQTDSYSLSNLQKGILTQPAVFNANLLVLDGGHLKEGQRSTVVDLTKNPPAILRQGSGKFPK